jgi:uncharacterized membrane protein
VYGQLVIKWQVNALVAKNTVFSRFDFLLHLLLNPWVVSSFLAAFIAAISWMLAVSKSQLSYAYPFMSLSFVIVLMLSKTMFNETLNWQKLVGTLIIVLGVIVVSRGTA